jgi:RimJ/RimL family protein N-acetyltransferase
MSELVSLVPLESEYHTDALQQVYRATPGYWQMYNLPGAPAGQAARDLEAATDTPGRTLMGIVRRQATGEAETAIELIGLVDFRLHWPQEATAYLGMLMVAEPYQRRGIGTQSWQLLMPWLAQSAQISKARLGIEQFNAGALQFFQNVGFVLTGETHRVQVGQKWIRLLYMERDLQEIPDVPKNKE